jgi:acetoin utilization protein AcuC
VNLPVPRGFNDAELELLIDDVVIPLSDRIGPEALVLTCGADALAGDPLASMALSNVALWDGIDRLVAIAPHVVVLGGGGYNPWTLARYWTGLWARLSRRPIPDRLPEPASERLRVHSCDLIDDEDVDPRWLTTLADGPACDCVRDEVRELRDRALARACELA